MQRPDDQSDRTKPGHDQARQHYDLASSGHAELSAEPRETDTPHGSAADHDRNAAIPDGGTARAFWLRTPGHGEIREVDLPARGPGDVLVRTLHTCVSRGTESLVFRGGVPRNQHERMRAPFQDGSFGGPVKYGYLNVGRVEEGPESLAGRLVFCLYPHQTRYVVPADAVVVVPDAVPAGRAVLAGTVETAVNALWDAAPLVGDQVSVVGAGPVGCCVAALLARMPGVRVELVDIAPARAAVADRIGAGFALPADARGDRDLVVHTSGTSAGLTRSLELLADEASVLELSWYGDQPVTVELGGDFHSRRLAVRSSQVGAVAPARRGRRSHADRLALALDLLADPVFDALVTHAFRFEELPRVLARIATGGEPDALAVRIDYEQPASR